MSLNLDVPPNRMMLSESFFLVNSLSSQYWTPQYTIRMLPPVPVTEITQTTLESLNCNQSTLLKQKLSILFSVPEPQGTV